MNDHSFSSFMNNDRFDNFLNNIINGNLNVDGEKGHDMENKNVTVNYVNETIGEDAHVNEGEEEGLYECDLVNNNNNMKERDDDVQTVFNELNKGSQHDRPKSNRERVKLSGIDTNFTFELDGKMIINMPHLKIFIINQILIIK